MGPGIPLRCVVATAFVASVLGLVPATASARTVRASTERCGDHAWCDPDLSPDERADLLVEALTLDERISLLGGNDDAGALGRPHTHTGVWFGVPRLDVPPFFQTDGPMGVRQGPGTAFPASIAVASSFDRGVARRQGEAVADEAVHKGDDLVYGPTVNILRTPLWGRAFETYGEDPYLAAQMGVPWIQGLQDEGVIANVKHFAVNNQEGAAGPGTELLGGRGKVDVQVDERTLREIYLPQFEAAIKQGKAGSVMCSYNEVNGRHACENPMLLDEILRKEWGFEGFVLADYGGSKHIDTGLKAGLDYEPFPFIDTDGGENFQPEQIRRALDAGRIEETDIDQAVHRLLRGLFAAGFFDRPGFVDDDTFTDKAGNRAAALEAAEAGTVLLQNEEDALPLDDVQSVALIGADADRYVNGGGSSAMTPYDPVTVREGLTERAADRVSVTYDAGSDLDVAAAVAGRADAAVVVVAAAATEGIDKGCLALDCVPSGEGHRDALIERVAAANPRTIVVMQTSAPVLTPWRDAVEAIVEAWYPGEAGGEAIAHVLFGDVDPGGRLPTTFPDTEKDLSMTGDVEAYPGVDDVVRYKEGVLVGYRWFDDQELSPAFPFGHGLSYTDFELSDVEVAATDKGGRVEVTLAVTNTGKRPGKAVPQLYVGLPDGPGHDQPPRQLKGFDSVEVAAGSVEAVRFELDERAFSYWDTKADGWKVATGCYSIDVGTSSRQIDFTATVAVGDVRCKDTALKLQPDLTLPPKPTERPTTTEPTRDEGGTHDEGDVPWPAVALTTAVLVAGAAWLLVREKRSRT